MWDAKDKVREPEITGADRIRMATNETMRKRLPVVDTWTELLMNNRERRVSLCIQPKPKWLPMKWWLKVVCRVIVIHEGPMEEAKS